MSREPTPAEQDALLRAPWPPALGRFPCGCPPSLPLSRRCLGNWIRCNERLNAVQEWRLEWVRGQR